MVSRLTRSDKWLIGILLFAAITGIGYKAYRFSGGGEQRAEIWVEGSLLRSIPLQQGYRQEIRIGGQERYDIVEVDGARVRVREADCPNQDCVLTGWIHEAPQQIVCLPYRIVIQIVSSTPSDTDAIAR